MMSFVNGMQMDIEEYCATKKKRNVAKTLNDYAATPSVYGNFETANGDNICLEKKNSCT